MKSLAAGQPYASRNPSIMPINLSLDKEAVEILRHNANGRRRYGRLISRLLYEFQARREERQRLSRASIIPTPRFSVTAASR